MLPAHLRHPLCVCVCVVRVFSYLDVLSLCRCASVSKYWNQVALDGSNWQRVDLFRFQTDVEVMQIVQHSTIQYSTTQYNTTQYNTVQCNTVQYSTIQYSPIQHSTIQYNTTQYNTVQCNTVNYSTIQ